VLLLRSDRAWRLPRVTVPTTWFANAAVVSDAFAARLATPAWQLRQLAFDDGGAVLELDLPDGWGWAPPAHARWAGPDELGTLRLRDEAHRPLLEAYLGEGEPPAERAPWARRGWREEAVSWLEAELDRLGLALTGVEQVKQWSISTILRVRTDGPVLYLKASARLPLFVDEGHLTAALAERFPDAVPAPLAIHPEGWLLLEDFGEPAGWGAPAAVRAEMFARFARLQRESAPLTDELLAAGCLDRRLPVLEAQLDALAGDAADITRLSEEEAETFRRRLPELKDACRRLAETGLPPTLVHGDLHLGNVARPGRDLLFFDWTDACVSHPFIDLHTLQWERDEEARKVVLDAYLAEWAGVASPEELRAAVRLAAVVTPLHHAVSYQTIATNVERSGRPELDAAHEFLREALGKLQVLSDT